MGKYIIDQEAFVAYLKEEIKARETAEVTFCHSGNYDSASKAVNQKYALGDILLKIEGSEYTPPFVKDEKHPDGFMVCTEDAPPSGKLLQIRRDMERHPCMPPLQGRISDRCYSKFLPRMWKACKRPVKGGLTYGNDNS